MCGLSENHMGTESAVSSKNAVDCGKQFIVVTIECLEIYHLRCYCYH